MNIPVIQLKKKKVSLYKALLFISMFLLVVSCNNEKKEETKQPEANINGISQMNCMIMTPEQVRLILEKGEGGEEEHKYSKLILRISSSDLTRATTVFELIGYKVRHHEEFGRENSTTPIILKAAEICANSLKFQVNTQYIFGNNEIAIKHLKRLGKKNDTEYNYLLFTPMRDASGQIYFTVAASDARGNKISMTQTNDDDTKPSPPAPPEP